MALESPAQNSSTPTAAGVARVCAPALATAVVAFLVYANALGGGFVFDDVHLIQDNEAITSVRYIPEILTENLWGLLGQSSNYYRPMAPLLYMLVYHLVGATPWAFHLLVIVFHAGASVLVFLLVARLVPGGDPLPGGRWLSPAFLAALLFATHPIHTEAVAWNAGIMDVSCAFFALLALHLHLRADRRRFWTPARFGALASFFLATLCKESALVLPAIVLVIEWLEAGRTWRAVAPAVRRSAPYFAVLAVHLAIRALALRGLAPQQGGEPLRPGQAALDICVLFAKYIEKLVAPVGLNVFHQIAPLSTLWSARGVLSLLAVLVFAALVVLAARVNRPIFLGLVLIAAPLAPALYLPALAQGAENAFAERYLYLPSVGFVLIAAAVLSWLGERSRALWRAAAIAALVASAVFAAGAVQRNRVWKDNLTLWSDAVVKSPESAAAHENYGYALYYAGRSAEGRRELDRALQLAPRLPDKIISTGIQYARKGLLKKALVVFETALLLQPDSADVHYNLGLTYEAQGWTPSAIDHYRRALALQPDFADAQINLGALLGREGRVDEAIVHLERAVELKPADAAARYNLAKAYELKGWSAKAAEQRQQADRLARP